MTYDTQPISDAAAEAFNGALGSGSPPDICFEAGAEAATQIMGDMGAPPAMIVEVITEAREDFEQGISDGMSPVEAFEAIDTESLGPDMGQIAETAHSAFEEAIENGATPADAFEAAAVAAGEECANQGIPPEMFEDATASLRTEFNEAIESGVDPIEAFDALEPPGMDEGMGAEYAAFEGLHSMAEHASGVDGGDAGDEGYLAPPPSDVGSMDALETAMGGEEYAPQPIPTDPGDAAMDSAMTQSANEEYAPPPIDTGGGGDYAVPPPPLPDAGGMDDASPPPTDDPAAMG